MNVRASKTIYLDSEGKATAKQPAGASRILVREGNEIDSATIARYDGAEHLLGAKHEDHQTTFKAEKTLYIDADGSATDKAPEGASRVLVKEGHEIDEATMNRYPGAAKLLGAKESKAKDKEDEPKKTAKH